MITTTAARDEQLERLQIFVDAQPCRTVSDGGVRFDLPPLTIFAKAPGFFHGMLLFHVAMVTLPAWEESKKYAERSRSHCTSPCALLGNALPKIA
jgi:hypothetical protein